LLVKTKPEESILHHRQEEQAKNEFFTPKKSASFDISNQFAKLFNSYTQSINKAENRTGSLLESPFRRIEITSDAYFSQLICYIHQNLKKRGFIDDFRDYEHSSYRSHLLTDPTKLKREEVINWFGNTVLYEKFHRMSLHEKTIQKLVSDT
jgi:putative transposase